MPNIRKLSKDETATTSLTVSGRLANAKFYVKPSKASSDQYEIAAAIDFAKCSPEEILRLAARTVVIDLQRRFRSDIAGDADSKKRAMDQATWDAVDVKSAIVDAARRSADPVAKARKSLEKLDDATRAALLAELTKKTK